jgi:hypothetical protein
VFSPQEILKENCASEKKKAGFSKTSVNFHQTTRHHSPEDNDFHTKAGFPTSCAKETCIK